MASQSLYRKWRSQTFGDLVGQEPIIRTLKNALSNGNLAHAYLFAGPRGTGKTSTARLLAKTINCSNPVNGEPCNTCQQCREITAGNSFNVIEIDAASNRGIDSIRDLREKVMMPPSTGKYKVYVLDEAHMLTTEAFNALLKTLEEPPDYAIFVMATTDVHKMLPTVLSRCQRFDFKRITTRQIVDHLNFVAEQEHIHIERPAAELIARAAAGGMRDALSLLDQAIAYAGNEIALAQVQAMLGVADPRAIQKLITHVAELESAAVLHLIHELSEAGADLRQINMQVGEYWRAIMLAKAGADIATILDRTEDETREIMQMTRLFALEELTEFARIFAQNDLMQKNQGTPQLGLELACLQSIELHRRNQAGPTQPVQVRPAPVQTQPGPTTLAYPTSSNSRASTSSVSRQATPPTLNATGADMPADDNDIPPPPEDTGVDSYSVTAAAVRPAPRAAQAQETVPPPVSNDQPALTLQQVKDAWDRVKKRVRGRNKAGPRTAAYLNDYAVVGVEGSGDATMVVIQAAHLPHYNYLRENTECCADVEWALKLEFDQPCRIRLVAPGQAVFLQPTQPTSSQAAYSAPPIVAQQSARRERPAAPVAPPAKQQSVKQEPPSASAQPPDAAVSSPSVGDSSEAVVKKHIVRENITTEVPRVSPEVIKQKAGSDPVVQEVVRTFAAKIVDIRLK
ncbi:MAG: DNA polymerase III subunit gamma/tau [Ktedonobacteraceae bacterium]